MVFMRAQRTLGVFAKRPRPGEVKTRLATASSADWAARVAEAFLLDTLARLDGIDARRVLAFAPADAGPDFERLAGGRFRLWAQGEGDLGARMAAFFREQLSAGGPVVLVGADSPTLPPEVVGEAFAALGTHDVVLGPAADGGYYLIGCAREVPQLFDGVAWGGGRVLLDTIARLPAWARLAVLPPWYDVDTLADWQLLRGHVAAQRRAGIDPGLPHTEPLLGTDPPGPGA
jgi:rSAM/selenodomain-associated transferase 1